MHGAASPLGLAQLVVPFEREQKQQWLAQTARASLLDDADPLLPLSSNAEQRRILEVLPCDTAAVIQGPPGTGKTHTIANLICALLADRQRVLVTSEKGQALRVLKDKIPEDVRDVCVLATGLRRRADDSLDRSITALSELQAGTDTAQLARTMDRLAGRRHDLLQRRKATLLDLQIVREDQYSFHRHGGGRYSGTLVEIARAVEADRPAYEWISELPPTATGTPALTDSEASRPHRGSAVAEPGSPATHRRRAADPPGCGQPRRGRPLRTRRALGQRRLAGCTPPKTGSPGRTPNTGPPCAPNCGPSSPTTQSPPISPSP